MCELWKFGFMWFSSYYIWFLKIKIFGKKITEYGNVKVALSEAGPSLVFSISFLHFTGCNFYPISFKLSPPSFLLTFSMSAKFEGIRLKAHAKRQVRFQTGPLMSSRLFLSGFIERLRWVLAAKFCVDILMHTVSWCSKNIFDWSKAHAKRQMSISDWVTFRPKVKSVLLEQRHRLQSYKFFVFATLGVFWLVILFCY